MGGFITAVTSDTLLAGAAILIAFWSAWTAHRAHKLVNRASDPAVSMNITPLKEHKGAHLIRVGIANRSDHPIKAESLQVVWPRNARLLRWVDASKYDSYGQTVLRDALPEADAQRSITMQLSLAHQGRRASGAMPGHYGTSDYNNEDAILLLPDTGKVRVIFRLRLAFSDTKNKRMGFWIFRSIECG